MSEKTKIVVIHMKELLYTIVFTILVIILLIVIIYMFLPETNASNHILETTMPSVEPTVSAEVPFSS